MRVKLHRRLLTPVVTLTVTSLLSHTKIKIRNLKSVTLNYYHLDKPPTLRLWVTMANSQGARCLTAAEAQEGAW